jgi:phosphoglycerate dehydrogenase-like enzyme
MLRLLNLYYPDERRFTATFPPNLLAELQEMIMYRRLPGPPAPSLADPAVMRELHEADILLTGWGTPQLPTEIMERGKVKYICHVTGTIRSCIPRELLAQGLLVSNWGAVISRTIAEAALMMILGCLRRVRPIQEDLHNRQGYRAAPAPDSLFERRVGLFGLGAIACELVSLLRPFHAHVSAYDPYVTDERFAAMGVQRAPDLRSLFIASDIVSVHAANTAETSGVIGGDLLKLLPNNGVLVNTARGALINEADLAAELQAGRLWAALDVFAKEPLPLNSPLRGLDRVLLFPHQGGPTLDRYIDMGRLAVDNIRRFLADEPVLYKVSTEQYDIMT